MLRSFLALLSLLAHVTFAWAGPGHDHGGGGHGPAPAATAHETPRIESVGTDIELVATTDGHKLMIYLDRSATNEPVDSATIEVSGEGIAPVTAGRLAPGKYEIEADWVDAPGTKALLFTVTVADAVDLLNGTLSVPEAAKPEAMRLPPLREIVTKPEILGLLLGALLLGYVIALAVRPRRRERRDDGERDTAASTGPSEARERRAAAIVLIAVLATAALSRGDDAIAGPGHDHGDGGHGAAPTAAGGNVPRKLPDGSVFVPKPSQHLLQVRTEPATKQTAPRARELIGTVVTDPAAFGQVQSPMDGKIEVTERGISYVGQKVRMGDVLALLSPTIPVADLGTLQQSRAEVEGKLKIAEQKLARLTRIANVVAQREIDDTRAELDALREQKRVLAPKDVEQFRLVAPVSGIISLANVKAGQVVSAREMLFEIVDPERLWVEGIGSDVHSYGEIATAQGLDAEGHALKLAYIGRAPTLRQQSRPFLFRIEQVHPGLAIGAPLKVIVQSKETAVGFIVPDAAVVRGTNGLPQVWIKTGPERFRPATIRSQQLDGSSVLVVAGIEAGDRIVINGAELINQIR